MSDGAQLAICQGCGAKVPLGDMFGVASDLRCPACAQGARVRLDPARQRTVTFRQATFVATKVLIGIAIALFLATDVVYRKKAWPPWLSALIQSESIWLGQWWRHVSSMFLHGGALHLLMNSLSLWFLGRVVELGWGWKTLLGLTLATGVVASCAQWVFSAPIPGVGLSGAIFGLLGFLWAMKGRHPVATAVMTPQLQQWALGWLVICVVLTQTGTLRIGNAAHIGGMVAGWVLGWAAAHARRKVFVPLAVAGCVAMLGAAHFVALAPEVKLTTKAVSAKEYRRMWLAGEVLNSPRHHEWQPRGGGD